MLPEPAIQHLTWVLRASNDKKKLIRLHNSLLQYGIRTHSCIGNQLVSMFIEVGSLSVAHKIVDDLQQPNGWSLNSLIINYVKNGKPRLALRLYDKFTHSFDVNNYGYLALIKACGQIKDLEKGFKLHIGIHKQGFLDSDILLGNALIDMYVKCGSIQKSQEVFDVLPERDVVSWTSLVSGFVKHERNAEALECFLEMQQEGVAPNLVTLLFTLKACGNLGAQELGQELHSEISRYEKHENDIVIGSALIDMYAKCGLVLRAQEVSEKLPCKNVVSWTALISGYVNNGLATQALDCYEKMLLEGIAPNAVTFMCCLKAAGRIGEFEKGSQIHIEIFRQGLYVEDIKVGNALIDMYGKCGSLVNAKEVFENLPQPDRISWNALITGYAKHELAHEVLNCYERMQSHRVSPDSVTYICSLKACGHIGAVGKGQEIHSNIARDVMLEYYLTVGQALVDMYAKCGALSNAEEVFHELPERDAFSWTALISGYVEHGHEEEALICYEDMIQNGTPPDDITYLCILKACAAVGSLDKGLEIHCEICRTGLQQKAVALSNGLVDMYAKSGALRKAQEVFDALQFHDIVSWSMLITGYANHDCCKEALHYFQQMQFEGFFPDSGAFVSLLRACSIIGSVVKGAEIHAEICRTSLLESDVIIGNALLFMYAKCGFLTKAFEVFIRLPVRDVISYTTMITGYAQIGKSLEVFSIFDMLIRDGHKPDMVIFLCVLSACNQSGLVDDGFAYYITISESFGMTPSYEHFSCMVDLLGRTGNIDMAISIVKNMQFPPNLVLWRSLLDACRKIGNMELGVYVDLLQLSDMVVRGEYLSDMELILNLLLSDIPVIDFLDDNEMDIVYSALYKAPLVGCQHFNNTQTSQCSTIMDTIETFSKRIAVARILPVEIG